MTERTDLTTAVVDQAAHFASFARALPAPDRSVPATPGWTARDTIGHVAMEPRRYADLARGRGHWPYRAADLPAFNADQIATLPTRDVGELADSLLADTADLVRLIESFPPGDAPLMNFDGDQRVRADRALGTLLGEFVVHG